MGSHRSNQKSGNASEKGDAGTNENKSKQDSVSEPEVDLGPPVPEMDINEDPDRFYDLLDEAQQIAEDLNDLYWNDGLEYFLGFGSDLGEFGTLLG